MKRVQYNHKRNLTVTDYTADVRKIIVAAGGKLVNMKPIRYSKSTYWASWVQRVEYIKDGENRVAYQYCSDGLEGEVFASWFWCPLESDCSYDYANTLVRPADNCPATYDEVPSDMLTEIYA